MRLVITAGPPDIWVGLEPETGEEAMALEACDGPGRVDEQTRRGHDLNAPRLGGSVSLERRFPQASDSSGRSVADTPASMRRAKDPPRCLRDAPTERRPAHHVSRFQGLAVPGIADQG